MKSEPTCYGIDDLERDSVGMWDDVRNYQARNFIRDDMKQGDIVLFYHSNAKVTGIVGLAKIVKEAYPDPMQFEATSYKYDEKATLEKPRWFSVDVEFLEKFTEPLTLAELKNDPFFTEMLVVKRGMRLSVQPVTKIHARKIIKLRSHLKTI